MTAAHRLRDSHDTPMHKTTRSLLLAFALLLQVHVAAQGPYYVNGQTGLDVPANGMSAATPWKTIGYAMAHAAPQTVATSDLIYVEGNQVYSPATNGESFPIAPAYNITLAGGLAVHGNKPVLAIPTGGVGFLFPGNQFFNRNQVTFRNLVLDGGDYGMRMGAAAGFRHRPRVQNCTFQNQAIAGIRIDNSGTSINDPRFFQNVFTGPAMGLAMYSVGAGAITQPDVEENSFQGLGGVAIDLDDQSPGGGNVGGQFRSNFFDNCAAGIRIRSSAGAITTNAQVRTSRFANLAGYAVEVILDHPFDPNVTVDQCAMFHCGGGVRLTGSPLPGAYTLTTTKNVIRDCGTGVTVQLFGQGNVDYTSRDNLIEACTTGIRCLFGSSGTPALQFVMNSQRDRILDCATGIDLAGGAPGSIELASDMVCRSTTVGVSLVTTSVTTLRSTTIADCNLGLYVTGTLGTGSALDHLVFGANATDAFVSPGTAITYSCFQGMSFAGVGNLSLTDPQLIRPYYKLQPSSPCVDAGNAAQTLPPTDYEGDPRASISVLAGLPVPDIGADEYVLAGSARVYGTGGFGLYNAFPRISAAGPNAQIGQAVQIGLDGALMLGLNQPASMAILSVGFRDDSGPLPVDLAAFGLKGSYLWNESTTAFPLQAVSPTGTATQTQNLPFAPSLISLVLTYQWFALMPATNGIVSSDALRVTIGQ